MYMNYGVIVRGQLKPRVDSLAKLTRPCRVNPGQQFSKKTIQNEYAFLF